MIRPVRSKPQHPVRQRAAYATDPELPLEIQDRQPIRHKDAQDTGSPPRVPIPQADEAALHEPRLEGVVIAIDMLEDGGHADIEDEIERRLQAGQAGRVTIAGLEEISALLDGPVIPQVAGPLEQKSQALFMAQPAGDVRVERADAIRMNIQKT